MIIERCGITRGCCLEEFSTKTGQRRRKRPRTNQGARALRCTMKFYQMMTIWEWAKILMLYSAFKSNMIVPENLVQTPSSKQRCVLCRPALWVLCWTVVLSWFFNFYVNMCLLLVQSDTSTWADMCTHVCAQKRARMYAHKCMHTITCTSTRASTCGSMCTAAWRAGHSPVGIRRLDLPGHLEPRTTTADGVLQIWGGSHCE